MQVDAPGILQALQQGLSQVPSAVLAILMLAGPTVAWLLYRFVVQPRRSRFAGGHGDALWACSHCRSANEVRSSRCYRCGLERDLVAASAAAAAGPGFGSGLPAEIAAIVNMPPIFDDVPAAVADDPDPATASAPDDDLLANPTPPPVPVPVAPRRLVAVGPGRPATKRASKRKAAANVEPGKSETPEETPADAPAEAPVETPVEA